MFPGTVMYVHNHVGIIMYGHKFVWAQTCVGTNVFGHKRVWPQTCVGTNVSRHKPVWAQTCVGTVMWSQSCGHNHVCAHTICMCTNVVEPLLRHPTKRIYLFCTVPWVPEFPRSCVIYKYCCPQCGSGYVDSTTCTLGCRISEQAQKSESSYRCQSITTFSFNCTRSLWTIRCENSWQTFIFLDILSSCNIG